MDKYYNDLLPTPLIDKAEEMLSPKYMNDVFTWSQIKKVIEECSSLHTETESLTVVEVLKILQKNAGGRYILESKVIQSDFLKVAREIQSKLYAKAAHNIKKKSWKD